VSDLDGTELVDWRQLPPDQRRVWWDNLWEAAIDLADRYRLALRSGWWQHAVQVEALAAFSGWLALYDTGAYTDPPGKLQLLWELERLRAVLRGGEHAFDPVHDRPTFDRYLDTLQHPTRSQYEPHLSETGDNRVAHRRDADELAAVTQRLGELTDRQSLLESIVDDQQRGRDGGVAQAERDLTDLRCAIEQLHDREQQLRRLLHQPDPSTGRE
jgi:hypothetical protein